MQYNDEGQETNHLKRMLELKCQVVSPFVLYYSW